MSPRFQTLRTVGIYYNENKGGIVYHYLSYCVSLYFFLPLLYYLEVPSLPTILTRDELKGLNQQIQNAQAELEQKKCQPEEGIHEGRDFQW
jgi:hypothetical protein